MEQQTAQELTSKTQNTATDYDLLLDIGVTLSIEMGNKMMKLRDLLNLNKNSVVELERAAGEPLDIKANGSLIARGEVVIVNGRYGVKLTEVVSKRERMEKL